MMTREEILKQTRQVLTLLEREPAVTGQARQVAALLQKLERQEMTVAIIGQFKRGKSSLSNRMLDDEVLPVGIVPITSAVTKVVYGPRAAEVHFLNGQVEEIAFSRLDHFISEQENADNQLGVASVVLHTPSPFLAEGLTFVDTPGVGSFHRSNTETAYRCMQESDAVIFLLSVDSPINQIEMDFLASTREFAGKFYFAVNKIDLVETSDLEAYMTYCRKLLCRLMETDAISLFPVSAKTGAGIRDLQAAILRDCKTAVAEILTVSTGKKLRDCIGRTLEQLDFCWKAMNLEYRELDARFAAVEALTTEIRAQAEQATAPFEVQLNEIRLRLSAQVEALFGMAYPYEIERVPEGLTVMDRTSFLRQVDGLCRSLRETLQGLLLYREENAYTVIRRIHRINDLSIRLRRIRRELAAAEDGEQ